MDMPMRLGTSTKTTRCCLFFFSSRRRHTRCSRDWSSDVCSSDLLHSAGDKVIDHDLRVFFPGVLDAELLAEQIDHCRGTAVVDRKTITAALRRVIDRKSVV